MRRLSRTERFTLEWLSLADESLLGECRGDELTALVGLGLAEIGPPSAAGADYRSVSLTAAGRRVVDDGCEEEEP